jgi:hypothetical protein
MVLDRDVYQVPRQPRLQLETGRHWRLVRQCECRVPRISRPACAALPRRMAPTYRRGAAFEAPFSPSKLHQVRFSCPDWVILMLSPLCRTTLWPAKMHEVRTCAGASILEATPRFNQYCVPRLRCVRCTANNAKSAGVTPARRSACPKVRGRCLPSFSVASRPNPGTD